MESRSKKHRRTKKRRRMVRQFQTERFVRPLLLETLEGRYLLASDWQNSVSPLNVDDDPLGEISRLDAVAVINEIEQARYSDPDTGEFTTRRLISQRTTTLC